MSTTVKLENLISLENLSTSTISELLNRAEFFLENAINKKTALNALSGKIIANLFFEPSTRTRNSFDIAAQRLGAMVLNPDMQTSATCKGESLVDTIRTFEALGTDVFVIRHADNNTANFVANELSGNAAVVNAGDGVNQHPTQALLDLLTIRQHKHFFGNLTVAIVGDIAHSRVARSLIQGLNSMGTQQIRLIAPKALVPDDAAGLDIHLYDSLKEGLHGVDVIVALRIQKERMQVADIPDTKKFAQQFGITTDTLAYAKPDAIVMHPGPINRGVEIESAVADGPQSVILQQVHNGVAVRMAVLDAILS